MRYVGLLVLLVAAIIVVEFSKQPERVPLNSEEVILAFGDSITYGYGASKGQSYPELLARSTGRRVINAGINGETSAEALRRFPSFLNDPTIRLVLLCTGGNDILQRQSLSELKRNLTQMVILAKAKKKEVLLVAVPNVGLLGLSPLELYEEVAEETDTPLLSGVLSEILSDPTLKSDQIHPNERGYAVLARRIEDRLRVLRYFSSEK